MDFTKDRLEIGAMNDECLDEWAMLQKRLSLIQNLEVLSAIVACLLVMLSIGMAVGGALAGRLLLIAALPLALATPPATIGAALRVARARADKKAHRLEYGQRFIFDTIEDRVAAARLKVMMLEIIQVSSSRDTVEPRRQYFYALRGLYYSQRNNGNADQYRQEFKNAATGFEWTHAQFTGLADARRRVTNDIES
jgi:hypothetical protein